MSSTPFCLGLPVVDKLEPKDGNYVLRTKSKDELQKEVRRMQQLLTKQDLIKCCQIGFRPDHPIPISMFFTEINIEIGGAEHWMHHLGLFSGAWHCVVTGTKDS